jgi:hypothetical protein
VSTSSDISSIHAGSGGSYCTAGAVASLIEGMKEDETLEIFGCEKDGAK